MTAIYALQSGKAAANPKLRVSDALLAFVDGITIRAPWKVLNPEPKKYNLKFVLDECERCAMHGSDVKLIVQTGFELAPDWIGGQQVANAPAPWSPQLHIAHDRLVHSLADGLDAFQPHLTPLKYVHITGPTYPSAEMHPAPGLSRARGYSPTAMVDVWGAAIDTYLSAFGSEVNYAISISDQKPADQWVGKVLDYAASVLGQTLVVEFNALKQDNDHNKGPMAVCLAQQKKGRRIAGELVDACATAAARVGTSDINSVLKIARANEFDFVDVYPPDLKKIKS